MENEEIILRVRSPAGMSRLTISLKATIQDLRSQIENLTNIPAAYQVIRRDSKQNSPMNEQLRTKLNSLNLEDGTELWVDSTKPITAAPTHTIEKRPATQEKKGPITIAGTKPPESKIQQGLNPPKEEITSKCNHGPGGRCLHCAPQKTEDDKSRRVTNLTSLCNHGPNGKCPNCINKDDLYVKHVSFEAWLEEKKSKCKDHLPSAKCLNCMPPSAVSYKVNVNCTNHLPFPKAMCNKCMPPAAIITRQPYRHVDYAQFQNSLEVLHFVNYWTQNLQRQEKRVGIAYGYYAEDPDYKNGVRAIVEAIYEPPQKGDITSFEFLTDINEAKVDTLAQALGLERIGWIFTSIDPHSILTSYEVKMAAKLQQIHVVEHLSGYKVSKFITIVLRPSQTNNDEIIPDVYMISDQGQALEKENIFGEPQNRKELIVREPVDVNDILPTIIVESKPVTTIAPEFFVVNIAHGQPKSNKFAIVKHGDFPVENRIIKQKPADVKSYLNKYKKEPSYHRFSDFHLLIYLMNLIDIDTICVIAESIRDEREIESHLIELVENYCK